jgi:uncharacterized RDD family membrane protein YckC
MTQAERYIEEVMRLLVATREERERFAADLKAHFEEAIARNQTAAEVIFKLGTADAVAEAFNAERPMVYAGFWRRVAAFFADVCIFVLSAIPVVVTAVAIEAHLIPDFLGVTLMVLCALAIFGLSLTYFPLLEARFGKTMGKHLLKIRVIDEGGRPVQLKQAIIRRLSFYFDFLALDALFIPFTPKKQRALDIVAKTVVIEEPGEEVPLWAWAAGLFGWIAIVAVIAAIALPHL